jgi:hypothetical protein
MKNVNDPTGALRQFEAGAVWEEVITNGSGSIYLNPYTTFRVRAAAATTVAINGVLAMTMKDGEIAIFNVGDANPAVPETPITVTIVGTCYLQVAREVKHKRQPPN